jgi:hypothetical protein
MLYSLFITRLCAGLCICEPAGCAVRCFGGGPLAKGDSVPETATVNEP